jgi:WD40 repeat protein
VNNRLAVIVTAKSGAAIQNLTLTYHVQVWDLEGALPVGAPIDVDEEAQFGLSRNQKLLALTTASSLSDPREVKIIEIETGKLVPTGIKGTFDSFVSSPHGLWVVFGRPKGVLNIDTQKSIGLEYDNPGSTHQFAFSPDGLLVASDGRVWSLVDGEQIGFDAHHGSWIQGLAFSSDGRLIATAGADRILRIRDIANVPVPDVTIRTGYAISDAAFSPDSQRI